MTLQQPLNSDRLHELLAARAIEPLTDRETTELDALLSECEADDIDSYDALAALLDVALFDIEPGPLVISMRQKINHAAVAILAKKPLESPSSIE